jgi:hypothetical protein
MRNEYRRSGKFKDSDTDDVNRVAPTPPFKATDIQIIAGFQKPGIVVIS